MFTLGTCTGKHNDRKMCAMDTSVLDYNLVFGATPDGEWTCTVGVVYKVNNGNVCDPELVGLDMNKQERLEFGESLMTHAMVFIGFDCDPNDPTKVWCFQRFHHVC